MFSQAQTDAKRLLLVRVFHQTHRTNFFALAALALKGMCVCVERLNRRKTSFFSRWFPWNIKLHCRGVQSTVETAPNEAIHLCWKQSLINPVYLLFQSSFARAKPRTAQPTFYFLYVCRNLYFRWSISLFGSTFEHFSPTF